VADPGRASAHDDPGASADGFDTGNNNRGDDDGCTGNLCGTRCNHYCGGGGWVALTDGAASGSDGSL
jgi:hypothetical protein